jgi:hypothetical protein
MGDREFLDDGLPNRSGNVMGLYFLLTSGNTVNSLKGGIPKIWEETLLFLLVNSFFTYRWH